MKSTAKLLIGYLCLTACAFAQNNEIAIRPYVGQLNLEGPAVTGPGDDIEGEDVDGFGIEIEYKRTLPKNTFGLVRMDWASWDSEFNMIHVSAGVGKPVTLRLADAYTIGTYLLLTAEFVSTDGLDTYEADPAYGGLGTGEDGDDLGVGIETGLTVDTRAGWSGDLYAKYYNFGEGDGPAFGLRIRKEINDRWSAHLSWDGTWVEEAGFNIDLAHQKIKFGVSRRF